MYQNAFTGLSTTTYAIVGCIIALTVVVGVILVLLFLMLRKKQKRPRNGATGGPIVYHNGGMDASAVYIGSILPDTQAGPLPAKVPEPPPYDTQPPPGYGSSIDAAHASRAGAASSVMSEPPEYRSKAGSVKSHHRSDRSHSRKDRAHDDNSGRSSRD